MQALLKAFDRFFLDEESSVSVALFRFPVALAVGAQFLPTFVEFRDNYSAWAFKTKNLQYFPAWIVQRVDASPDWLIQAMAAAFVLSWLGFLAGFLTQASAIALFCCANYFYCLNFTPHGMLSMDILLVTLFLMTLTPYPGDYFSIDARLWSRPARRPLFLLRLLQLQLAITYLHTGWCKLQPGNWWTANPYHYLMNNPPGGIVKDGFVLKAFLAPRPGVCKSIGLTVVVAELVAPVLLCVPPLRWLGIALGLFFQLMLALSLHVPTTTFLFTFPLQLLLFIPPKEVARWLGRS